MNSTRVLLCLIAIGLIPIHCLADDSRLWKSASGKFSVNASLLDVSEESVQLKRDDTGKVISVPIRMLSKEDQGYLAQLPSKTSPPETRRPTESTSGKTPGMPDSIGIEAISDLEYRLVPFGKIEVPADGMLWRIASREPPVFVAEKPNDPQALVLTVMAPCRTQPERVATLKATYNTLIEQLQKTKLTDMKGTKPDFSGAVPDKVTYGMMGKSPEGTERHFIVELHFHEQYSFLFQAASTNAENANFIISDTKTFVPNGSKPRPNIPDDVQAEIDKAVTRMEAQMLIGDVEGLLKDLMPPEDYERFHSDELTWTRLVDNFKKQKAGQLKQALSQMDWSKAEYDAETKAVTFPVTPRDLVFEKVENRWRLAN